MSAETQYKVACEFGYPENLVLKFLKKKKYRSASELVDELEDYVSKCEEEEEELVSDEEKIVENGDIAAATASSSNDDEKEEPASEEKKIVDNDDITASSSTTKLQPLTLKEETNILYKQSRCPVCWKNSRCVVILPCSHLVLCHACLPSTSKCPLRSCGESIECGILTYM